MAYCDKCGAYIPDGQNKCLACGYDAEAEARAAAAQAAAAQKKAPSGSGSGLGGSYYSFTNEGLKEKLEQQRERQKEISRKWAEAERERRQAQKEREAQSHVNRSSASYSARDGSSYETRNRSTGSPFNGSTVQTNKILAALSYVSVLFILPFFVCPSDGFAKFHAKQGLALFAFGVVANILRFIPFVGLAGTLLRLFCVYKGISNVINGRTEPLPVIGKFGLF